MSGIRSWLRPVAVLVGLELRQRTRATRWRILLLVLFLAISVVVLGSQLFARALIGSAPGAANQAWSENLYLIVVGFVGFLGLVLAPTTTATAINGDRKDATLAVVQQTPVTAAQLALGKLVGAWLATCALLVVASPYIVWAIAVANYPVLNSVLGIVVVMLLFLAYCGIGLGFSALLSRPIGSAAMTQLTMLFLLVGLPLAVFAAIPATETTVTAQRPIYDWEPVADTATCRTVTTEVTVAHPERVWWLVAPNPVVIVADAAAQVDVGRPPTGQWPYPDSAAADDPRKESGFGALARAVSQMRTPPAENQDRGCESAWPSDDRNADGYLGNTWYWGLLANLVLGGAGLAVAIARLRVPAGNLPRGVRIA